MLMLFVFAVLFWAASSPVAVLPATSVLVGGQLSGRASSSAAYALPQSDRGSSRTRSHSSCLP